MLAEKLLEIALKQLSRHDDEGEGGSTLDSTGGSVRIGGSAEMMLDRTGGTRLV